MAFAGRALLAALAFLVLYALAFSLVRSRWQPRAENQAVQNAIVLQTYAFEKSGSPVVLVGSSMTRRLPEDALPAGWFNLSFGGMSALEGLGIIDRIGARPNLIVVEINTLDKAPQLDWINRHTTPGFWTLQRLFPSLRNSNRPVTVALSYAQSGWRKASDWLLGPPPLEVIARRPASAEDLPEHTMARLVVEWQQRPSIEHQETFVHNLAPLMERLESRGSRFVFVEIPIHTALCDLPKSLALRELVSTRLASYPFFRPVPCSAISTTDGVHLSPAAAAVVAEAVVALVRDDERTRHLLPFGSAQQ